LTKDMLLRMMVVQKIKILMSYWKEERIKLKKTLDKSIPVILN